MNGTDPVKENISEEVFNLLTEEEKANLLNFNKKGISVKNIIPSEKVDFLEEATDADESDEEDTEVLDDFDENDSMPPPIVVGASSSTNVVNTSSASEVLKDTNQDFSDLFSDF